VALAVPSNSLEQRAKVRVATIRVLVVMAARRNSLEVRVATIRVLVVVAARRNSLEVRVATIRAVVALAARRNSLEVRVATTRVRSVFPAKAIGFAAATSRKSTSCPRLMVACSVDCPAQTLSRLTGRSPPMRSSLAGRKAQAHAFALRTRMAASGSFARAEVAPALELRTLFAIAWGAFVGAALTEPAEVPNNGGDALGSFRAHAALRRKWSTCTPDLNRCVERSSRCRALESP